MTAESRPPLPSTPQGGPKHRAGAAADALRPAAAPKGRRVAVVWLPRLAAERFLRRAARRDGAPYALAAGPDGDAPPFAVIAETRGALRLVSVSASAEAAGLRPGLSLADARAVSPELRTAPADPAAETLFLAHLRRWAERYCPWVGLDGADGLALDITGSAHLFGGEAAALEDLTARLAAQGLTAVAAAADCKGAAWALSRWRADAPLAARIAAPGATRAALADAPLAALRLEAKAAEGLARLGVRSVRELAALPRASLARRFGTGTLRRLDQALGAEPEPIAPAAAPPHYAARLTLPEPIGRAEDLIAGAERLLTPLCRRLQEDHMAARRLVLTVRRVDGGAQEAAGERLHGLTHGLTHDFTLGLARPSRDERKLGALLAKKIADAAETLDLGFGVDALRLWAPVVEALGPRQTHAGAFDAPSAGGADDALGDLLTRLGQRLGLEALTRFIPVESWAPEKAFRLEPAAYSEASAGWAARLAARPPRPLSVFAPEPLTPLADPEPLRPPTGFRWRGRDHALVAAEGPERIAPEWWLDDPAWRSGVRDYWRIETDAGLRLWLFHTPQRADDPVRPPCWFVTGRFD